MDEFDYYLSSLAESLGADINVAGCVNPRLALAARIQLKIMDLRKDSEIVTALMKEHQPWLVRNWPLNNKALRDLFFRNGISYRY